MTNVQTHSRHIFVVSEITNSEKCVLSTFIQINSAIVPELVECSCAAFYIRTHILPFFLFNCTAFSIKCFWYDLIVVDKHVIEIAHFIFKILAVEVWTHVGFDGSVELTIGLLIWCCEVSTVHLIRRFPISNRTKDAVITMDKGLASTRIKGQSSISLLFNHGIIMLHSPAFALFIQGAIKPPVIFCSLGVI